MHNLYHITLLQRPGVSEAEIQKVMDRARDWFHYSRDCWIICTKKDAKTWYERLAAFAKPGGVILICRIDPNDRKGFANKQLWTWLAQFQAAGRRND